MFRGSDFPHWKNNEPPKETTRSSSSLLSTASYEHKLGRITRSCFRPDAADQLCDGAKRPPPAANDHHPGKVVATLGLWKPVVEMTKKEIKFQPADEIHGCLSPQQHYCCTKIQADISLPPLVKRQKSRNSDDDDVTKPCQPKRWQRTMVDVMPGFQAPLIGVKESLEAYRSDRCVHTHCYECDTFLYCISAANLVLCSQCQSISPTDKHIPLLIKSCVILGIGLTVDHVLADPDGSDGHF
jgi:hypothetical protein